MIEKQHLFCKKTTKSYFEFFFSHYETYQNDINSGISKISNLLKENNDSRLVTIKWNILNDHTKWCRKRKDI